MAQRIDRLTPAQEARMVEWVDRWIEIGLRTAPADRETFEHGVRQWYRFAGLAEPRVIVWCPSPLVAVMAGPIAASLLYGAVDGAVRGAVSDAVGRAVDDAVDRAVDRAVDGAVRGAVSDAVGRAVDGAVDGAVRGAVSDAVGRAVDGAVRGAVRGAVSDAVGRAVDGAVRDAVGRAVGRAVDGAVSGAVDGAVSGAVRGAVSGAVGRAVDGAVDGAVRGAVSGAVGRAVDGAVRGAVRGAVSGAVRNDWFKYIGGQFWVGGWYWGPAYQSFFRDVCGLELPGDLWDRLAAHEMTAGSACWWWPGSDFVMVSERPSVIHREQIAPRGWGSHRLHCEDGPAIAWEGWAIWAIHGIHVAEQVVMAPETLTADQIAAEPNVEVRRVMIERLGAERYVALSGAKRIARDDWGTLYRAERPGDSPLMAVAVVNSTPEPDGRHKDYWLRVPGVAKASQPSRTCLVCDRDIRGIPKTARQAVAWLGRLCAEHYSPTVET